MNATKDAIKVKAIFDSGNISILDPETKYRYSLMAFCPRCQAEAYVARYERWGPKLSRVMFTCSRCFNTFEAAENDAWVV